MYLAPPSSSALKLFASAPIVVRARIPMTMPLMVRKLRSFLRTRFRTIWFMTASPDVFLALWRDIRVGGIEVFRQSQRSRLWVEAGHGLNVTPERERPDKCQDYNQPFSSAMRAASTRLCAFSFWI